MFKVFKHIPGWRRKRVSIEPIPIVRDYYSNLSTTCNFPELPDDLWDPCRMKDSLFVVPRLSMFHRNDIRIKRHQLLQVFLSFLLQLLFHTDPMGNHIENLEKELRYLLTILGDISWMLVGNDELEAGFQNLLSEFEAVANQAGRFVHTLLFSTHLRFKKMDKGAAAILKRIELLKADVSSFITTPADATPRTSIVNSFLFVDSLVDHLEDLLKQEDDRITNVKDQLYLLHQGLMLFNSSINDIRSPQPSELGELKEPLMRIGDVAHQAEYLISAFLVEDAPLWYVIKRLTELNHEVEVIRSELHQFGGLKVVKYLSAERSLQDKRPIEADEVIVGFEDKETDILDQLVGGGTWSLKVISIFGMPGLGKTTLAKKLYNHPLVNYTFQKLSWSVVSQTFKRQSILANILIQINVDLDKDRILKMEEETLVENVYKTLKGRRYLVVLDDVWNLHVWDALRMCFPDDGNGSRILFTNRNKDAAPPNSIIHELPFLSDEQCWELLEKKVFGSRTCPPQLQEIGMRIAAKCRGLPLTAVVIAGILSTVDEEEESRWEEVEGSLASYIDGEDNLVMKTLELSYKHLPDYLKPCFLYFGAFEEDKEISVESLMRLWVAEGFIRLEKDKSGENIAEEYLMELTDRSLVMVSKRRSNDGGAEACVVHDLLHDLCLKKCQEESFLEYLKSDCHTVYEIDQQVRSFHGGHDQTSSLYVRDMRSLRVLVHFNSILENHTIGMEYLSNLRYLVIGQVPKWLDRLPKLEYLCVKSLDAVYIYPSTLVKMKKLRYLYAWFVEFGEDWSSTDCESNSLEYLSDVVIKEVKDIEMLKFSLHLRKLKCRYVVDSKELDPETFEIKWAYRPLYDLRFLTQLDSLSLRLFRFHFKGFKFPSNIRKLTLIDNHVPWEQMSLVGRLENLEVLKLKESAGEGDRWDTRDGEFQKLRFLQLAQTSLHQWNVASNEHFPRLQQLILINCYILERIPDEIGEITTLELIEVKCRCQDSLVESAERIRQEQQDMGNEGLRIVINTTN